MPSKQQLDKQAWDWAEKDDLKDLSLQHIWAAYRLNLKPCKSPCRRNCKGNPHCLSGLGEKKWLAEIEDEAWHEVDDPSTERKQTDFFSGLKNLGATCYVNSFLQVWYHNHTFRQALYLWDPKEDPEEVAPKDNEEWKPQSKIGSLQFIFALMQFSNRRYIDPTPLIKSLGLDENYQQDAQEFCKLFMSLLEERLSFQSNPWVQHIIQNLFQGQLSYITKCHKCLNESHRPANYYELDLNIKGHNNLSKCLEEFLKEERLDNNNQYFCDVCQTKQDASRSVKLVTLPQVLNLQLLRFVFDRQTGTKKKLSSFIRFPEQLDMAPYVSSPHYKDEGQTVYQLSAVLIHKGPSAYSGHYVAHIRDTSSGLWYKFNDDNVEKMEAKTLSSADSETGSGRTPKLARGTHATNNAYLLVYTRQGGLASQQPDTIDWTLPPYLRSIVDSDNKLLEEYIQELTAMREHCVTEGKTKQEKIKNLYEQLIKKEEEEELEWLSTDWLSKWLNSDSPVASIDHRPFVCPHSKLSPDAVTKMKCISRQAADKLFSIYPCNLRFQDALCWECVREKAQAIKTKLQLQDEHKLISTQLRLLLKPEEPGFWVGKSSLRSWRKMALSEGPQNLDESLASGEGPLPVDGSPGEANENEDNDDSPLSFNEDICCKHGLLSADEKIRKLVQEPIWAIFRTHFPTAPEFTKDATPCTECKVDRKEESSRQMALNRRNMLPDLYYNHNRPYWQMADPNLTFYLVSHDFVDQWRKFIREPFRAEPVEAVDNASLLCQHDQLLYKPPGAPQLVLVWEKEWRQLAKTVTVDRVISVNWSPQGELVLSPPVCEMCSSDRNLQAGRNPVVYERAKIYVRKLVRQAAETEPEPTAKKLKVDDTADPSIRRSHRRRRHRDEKDFYVSSSQTLLDLKKMLRNHYWILPCEQTLYLDQVLLDDDSATLASLSILPDSLITLEVDASVADGHPPEEIMASDNGPETGFKGTQLQS